MVKSSVFQSNKSAFNLKTGKYILFKTIEARLDATVPSQKV